MVSWALRAICASVVLAVTDMTIESRAGSPPFSFPISRTKHEAVYVGGGYTLRYHTHHGGTPGPDLWFWFAPVRIQMWSRPSVHWLWSLSGLPSDLSMAKRCPPKNQNTKRLCILNSFR